jgi:predicted flavoprotein YhiN
MRRSLYRRINESGAVERNVNIFAKRMKGGKSWSQQGASNISKIIALKIGKDFPETIAALVSGRLSERLTERFEETLKPIKNPVKKASKSIYTVHQGKIAFIGLKQRKGSNKKYV